MTGWMFYRYLGGDTTVAGHDLPSRTVFGENGEGAMVLSAVPSPFAYPQDKIAELVAESRAFKASPVQLFSSVDFTKTVKETSKTEAVAAPKAPEVKVVKDVERPQPINIDRDVFGEEDAYEETAEDAISRRRAEAEMDTHTAYKSKPLSYSSYIHPGGTPQNYMVRNLVPVGGTELPVVPVSEARFALASTPAYDLPQYVFEDLRDNVLKALGLKVKLPFNRLAVGATTQGTMIVTQRRAATLYGVILIDADQLYRIMGGFNSRTVAQAVTHELAHFIDQTMIKNSERMKFQQALRGKDIHPAQPRMGAQTTSMEQFATLAELMVWGDSLRRVFYLNGFDVVNKYFVNRYVTEEDLKNRTI